jgi:hypothetical protein
MLGKATHMHPAHPDPSLSRETGTIDGSVRVRDAATPFHLRRELEPSRVVALI